MGWIYEAYRRDSQNSKKNAKKCKTMIQKYFADKEMAKLVSVLIVFIKSTKDENSPFNSIHLRFH